MANNTPFVAGLCAFFRSFGTNRPFVNKKTINGDQSSTGFRLGAKFSHANFNSQILRAIEAQDEFWDGGNNKINTK